MKICPVCHCGSMESTSTCSECSSSLADARYLTGQQLKGMVIDGKYELVEIVGEGAMAWVYRGLHRSLGASVAVKLLKPGSTELQEVRNRRFEFEAQAASKLNQPHIISIMDYGHTPGGIHFIVSEYLHGPTLNTVLVREGKLPVQRSLAVIDQVLAALEEAHGKGLVHRDLKPENIIITSLRSGEDYVKVVDFGIAKTIQSEDTRLTREGQVCGTPAFMAPEQIRGRPVGPQADIYACGVMLHWLITGVNPFETLDVASTFNRHLVHRPPPVQELEGMEGAQIVQAVIDRALQKDPQHRFQSATEFRNAMGPVLLSRDQHTQYTRIRKRSTGAATVVGAFDTRSPKGSPTADDPALLSQDHLETADLKLPASGPGSDDVSASSPAHEEFQYVNSTVIKRLYSDPPMRFHFVGRREELKRINGFLDEAGGVMEISGEEGSGRTRLLDEVGRIARRRGLRVLRTGPDPATVRSPWFPVRCLVASALRLPHLRPSKKRLAKHVKEAGLSSEELPGITALLGLHGGMDELERQDRAREIHYTALRVLFNGPVLQERFCILLDDVDRFDQPSLNVARSLAAAQSSFCEMIFTCTSPVIDLGSQAVRIELQPLSRAQLARLFSEALRAHEEISTTLCDSLHEHFGGNTLHAIQAIRLFAEGGSELQSKLADLMVTRIGRLPGQALRTLQSICVCGQSARIEVVECLAGVSVLFREVLDLLVSRGFIHLGPCETALVTHPLIVRTVMELMPAAARKDFHRKALEVLGREGASALELARHARPLKLGQEELDLLIRAGRMAEDELDDRGAAELFQAALQLARWELLYESNSQVCVDLTVRLGEALRGSGDLVGADLVIREALEFAHLGHSARAKLFAARSRLHAELQQPEESIRSADQAFKEARAAADLPLQARALADMGALLGEAGDWDRARRKLTRGLDQLRRDNHSGSDSTDLWRVMVSLATVLDQLGDSAGALSTATSALHQASSTNDMLGAARCNKLLGQVKLQSGQDQAGKAHLQQALASFRAMGDRVSAAECNRALAVRDVPHDRTVSHVSG